MPIVLEHIGSFCFAKFGNLRSTPNDGTHRIENIDSPQLTIYKVKSDKKVPAVIVCPGGGYGYVTFNKEGTPIAKWLQKQNIAAVILSYRNPSRREDAFADLIATVKTIKEHADEWNIDANLIGGIGFSAGGHLASLASCYHTKKEFADLLNITQEEMKINACLLSYPVISMDFGHEGSIKAITGNNEELKKFLSVDKNITKDFPKTFIWTTVFDTIVPSINTTMLINELAKNKITFESHIYPMCDHGLSLADDSVFSDDVDKDFDKNVDNMEKYYKEIRKIWTNIWRITWSSSTMWFFCSSYKFIYNTCYFFRYFNFYSWY